MTNALYKSSISNFTHDADQHLRLSQSFNEVDIIGANNVLWPERPSFRNPIVSIYNKAHFSRFDFQLKDGARSNMLVDETILDQHCFDPDSVSVVVLWWVKSTALLTAIQLFDSQGQIVCSGGEFHDECLKHTFKLKRGERLVGIASFTNFMSYHHEFQLIIASGTHEEDE